MNIRTRAATLYDRALDSGEPFTVADIADDLVAALLDDDHDLSEIVGLAAAQAIRAVDKERTASRPQASLFDSLDQSIAIAEGRRLARRDMRFGDWTAHLSHVAENASRVNYAAARENHRFTEIARYLAEGLTTEQATKAWLTDNVGGDLA